MLACSLTDTLSPPKNTIEALILKAPWKPFHWGLSEIFSFFSVAKYPIVGRKGNLWCKDAVC